MYGSLAGLSGNLGTYTLKHRLHLGLQVRNFIWHAWISQHNAFSTTGVQIAPRVYIRVELYNLPAHWVKVSSCNTQWTEHLVKVSINYSALKLFKYTANAHRILQWIISWSVQTPTQRLSPVLVCSVPAQWVKWPIYCSIEQERPWLCFFRGYKHLEVQSVGYSSHNWLPSGTYHISCSLKNPYRREKNNLYIYIKKSGSLFSCPTPLKFSLLSKRKKQSK